MSKQQFLDFANILADEARIIAKKYYRKSALDIETKDDSSPVTIADQEIEKTLRDLIIKNFPEHNIYGEEYGVTNNDSSYCWYLDPIDGTSSFISGRPLFTTLIALTFEGKPILSIVDQPILEERWQSIDCKSSFFNGEKIGTRNITDIDKAILSTTSLEFIREKYQEAFNKLRKVTSYQRHGGYFTGGDAYQYMQLANGYIDIVFETTLKPYDFIALIPIVEGAGGIITDMEGNKLNKDSIGDVVASANQELHDKVLELII